MLKWYEQKDENSDVIISSRIRLARNLESYPFSARLLDKDAKELVSEVMDQIKSIKMIESNDFSYSKLKDLTDISRLSMVERHTVSPLLANKKQDTGLVLSSDESISIMINEEDHIRIQCLSGGMNIQSVFDKANELDDLLYEKIPFAFNEKYGYLTSCPTNVGTGLRASYMVFLPALSVSGMVSKLAEEVGKFGITIRGMYGEGSKSLGHLFQVSNQKTLGNSEVGIIDNLNHIVIRIMEQERQYRTLLLYKNYNEIEDQIFRSYGILKHAKQINTSDAMMLLSQFKVGIDTQVIKIDEKINIYSMMMDIQPASIQYLTGKSAGRIVRDRERAKYLNDHLPNIVRGGIK